MKISILLPDLRGGGAEGLHLVLAKEFISRGYKVDFVVMRKTGDLLKKITSDIIVHDLKAPCFRSLLFPLIRFLKQERPDTLLAAMWPLTSFAIWSVYMSRVSTRVVVSDHSILSKSPPAKGAFGTIPMRITMQLSYRWADGVVGVSKGVKKDIAELTNLDCDKISTIYNPAARGAVPAKVVSSSEIRPWLDSPQRLVTVGTLKAVKDHISLLNAFSRVIVKKPRASLLILGKGEMRSSLEKQIEKLGLQEKVLMPGYVSDPYPYYMAADLFVLTSKYEGFGNVIVEAMECGLPIVSTDCESGPREILDYGKYGKLVPVGDVYSLSTEILKTLEETQNPDLQKNRACEFSIEKAVKSYLELLDPEENITP